MIFLVCILFASAAVLLKKLTLEGGAAGLIVSCLISLAWGWWGIGLLGFYFLLAVLATGRGIKKDHAHQQKRDQWQVLANGGVAALMAALVLCGMPSVLMVIMAAGSLASAAGDTVSSELGTVYGSRFFNIRTLKTDERGLDGVISFEGTLAGFAASAAIAAAIPTSITAFIAVLFGGILGNLLDSYLGAVFERRNLISNNAVNFINTLAGAVIAGLIWLAFK